MYIWKRGTRQFGNCLGGASWNSFGHASGIAIARLDSYDFSVAGRLVSTKHSSGMPTSDRHVSGSLIGGFYLHYNMKDQRF